MPFFLFGKYTIAKYTRDRNSLYYITLQLVGQNIRQFKDDDAEENLFQNDGKYNTSEMCDISKKRLVFFRKKDQSRRIIMNKS